VAVEKLQGGGYNGATACEKQTTGDPMALTKRQKEVLDYLISFETKHGYSPSFEEIGKGLKLTSLATVHKHITTLEKKGFIRRGYNQSRSIEILQLPKPVKDQVLDRRSRNCRWWAVLRPGGRWRRWKSARRFHSAISRVAEIHSCYR